MRENILKILEQHSHMRYNILVNQITLEEPNMYSYTPVGVCSKKIDFEVVDNKITKVIFTGGCSGNLSGISSLIEGMNIDEVIKRLDGIKCGFKGTSCPDQLSKALKSVLVNKKKTI